MIYAVIACTSKGLAEPRSFFVLELRLGAQSVTLLSTLRDPTQLRRRQCACTCYAMFEWKKNSNSYCSSEANNRSDKKSSASSQKKFG